MTDLLSAAHGPRLRRVSLHHFAFGVFVAALLAFIVITMRWDWIPVYWELLLRGLWTTLWLLLVTFGLGFSLAIMLGLARNSGRLWMSLPAQIYCTVIRGTPLLLQLWLLYYGLGSLFPQFPAIRQSELWIYLRQAWPYAVVALTLSCAGYLGEVMRGALANVPAGQLEAAKAFGLKKSTIFWRIHLPQAVYRALPTISGEAILQLKATPLVATISVVDIFSVASRIRQETYLTYEPLLFVACIYMSITAVLVLAFNLIERRIPRRVG